jgi:hypothetical protein
MEYRDRCPLRLDSYLANSWPESLPLVLPSVGDEIALVALAFVQSSGVTSYKSTADGSNVTDLVVDVICECSRPRSCGTDLRIGSRGPSSFEMASELLLEVGFRIDRNHQVIPARDLFKRPELLERLTRIEDPHCYFAAIKVSDPQLNGFGTEILG